MTLGGLWHGASWTFVFWGAAHGTALVLVRYFGFPVPAIVKQVITFLFVALTWVLFRSDSAANALLHFQSMLDFSSAGFGIEAQRLINWAIPLKGIGTLASKPGQAAEIAAFAAAGFLCFTMPNSQSIALWSSARKLTALHFLEIPMLIFMILVLSLAFISPDTTNAFIYFAF